MQRRAIRGADLKPDANQYAGMLNAEKCVKYLRGIGVEIDDATADAWLDTQATFRFLKSERTVWRSVRLHRCRCGEMEGYSEVGRGRVRLPKRTGDDERKPARCESCGTGFLGWSLLFAVRRDGTIRDLREGADAVVPLRLDEFAGGLCA